MSSPAVSTGAPLRLPTFRRMWTAQLGSNLGTWMQTVGAQWLLIHEANATTLVSLVQAASLLPVMFLSLPAGVLADVVDRRRLMIGVSIAMAAIAAALAAFESAGLTTPALLLVLTFALGCCQAVLNPAQQAIQPDLVPREQIAAASALGSLNVNVARAVGPAVAGVLVAATSPGVVFAINAVSFLGVVVAVWLWHPDRGTEFAPERVGPALAAGGRYVRHAPGVRRILVRAALFVLPASALWALLPIVASDRLHLGSAGYGMLLGALGVGSILGAVTMGWIRDTMSRDALLAVGAVVFGVGTATAALVPNTVVVLIVMVPAGVAWLIVLSTLNSTLQLALPAWVRARALATYLVVFMGGQGIGSILWGAVGQAIGVPVTLTIAAALLLVCAVSEKWLPLGESVGTLDRTPIAPWPEPQLVLTDADRSPVLVTVRYPTPHDQVDDLVAAVHRLEDTRRRTGAIRWGAFRPSDDADDMSGMAEVIEVFLVPSWEEHLRQHHQRMTGYDAQVYAEVLDLTDGDPISEHLIER